MNKNNKIPHLRICVTEVCENRCLYCRPGGEACRTTNEREMSIKQIFYSVNLLAKHGISHLKITGGEPLLRSDILKLIKLIGSIEGIEDIELITRSPNVGNIASQLKELNISYLNFSLDTLDPVIYYKINHNRNIKEVLEAIDICHKAGLALKFNMVVMKGINDNEISEMIHFAGKYGAVLKLLDLVNVNQNPHFFSTHYKPFDEIIEELRKKNDHEKIIFPPGGVGTPMLKYEMSNGATVMIKDARKGTWYSDVCNGCNNYPCQDAIMALRLTSDGYLQRCLLNQGNLIDFLSMIENNENQDKIAMVLSEVLDTYRKAIYHESCWKPY